MRTAVINNREGLEQVQMQPTGKDLAGTLLIGECLTLLPGLNLIDSKKLEAARKNPMFEQKFTTLIPKSMAPEQNPEKAGKPILVVMEFAEKDKEGKVKRRPVEVEDLHPLEKLSEEHCQVLIGETLVPDVLRIWSQEEARPGVRLAIAKQLESIGAGTKTAGPAGQGR